MESITLDLIPNGIMPVLHASQYDISRSYHIDITELGTPYKLDGTETLTINERKGDNCICTLDVENAFANKTYIEFTSTEQMCAVWGSNLCELRIIKGGVDLGTLNFILEVEASPIEGGIQSESEINNLYTQIDARVDEDVEGRLDDYATKEWVGEECYDKTYIDNALGTKANTTDVNNALANKMNKNNPNGTGSIAVGSNLLMFGYNSQAFGSDNIVGGNNSFVAGVGNESAIVSNRFVFGSYSKQIYDADIIEIVGNGTNDNNRSNARTLDKNGKQTLAGDLVYNGNKSITSEVQRLDGRIDALPEAMVFKGTLGTGGTVEVLPVASAENEGWTYKVITAGTYAGQTAKVGDVFTSDGFTWVLIPAGDEDSDTWRAIKVEGVEKLGNGISSGAVDFRGSANIDVTFDADGNKVEIATKNIYTQTEVNNLVAQAIVDILPTETKSGSVANFETDLELPYQLAKFGIVATQEAGTPTPSSPKAISGWSEVKITRCGANLCNQADIVSAYPSKYTVDTDGSIKTVGNLSVADVLWTNKSKVSGVLNVIFVSKYQNTGSVGIRPKIIYTDGTNNVIYATNTQDYSTKTILTTSSKTVDKIVVDYGTNNPTNFYLMVTLDTSATTYEAYNGQEITIALGDTYYGGYVTQDKAGHRQLVVTYGIVDMGDLSWNRYNFSGTYCFYVQLPLMKARYPKGMCNIFEKSTQINPTNLTNYTFLLDNGTHNKYIYLRDDDYTDKDTFKTAMVGNKFVYELAEPIVIDLPDGEPINALVGTNNVFCDSGDTEVTYKLSINKALSNLGGGNRSVNLAKSVEEEVKEEVKDEPETRQER